MLWLGSARRRIGLAPDGRILVEEVCICSVRRELQRPRSGVDLNQRGGRTGERGGLAALKRRRIDFQDLIAGGDIQQIRGRQAEGGCVSTEATPRGGVAQEDGRSGLLLFQVDGGNEGPGGVAQNPGRAGVLADHYADDGAADWLIENYAVVAGIDDVHAAGAAALAGRQQQESPIGADHRSVNVPVRPLMVLGVVKAGSMESRFVVPSI